MFKKGDILKTDADFENARMFATLIEVFQKEEAIDRGGVIKCWNEEAVYIEDGYFLRELCQFRIK